MWSWGKRGKRVATQVSVSRFFYVGSASESIVISRSGFSASIVKVYHGVKRGARNGVDTTALLAPLFL